MFLIANLKVCSVPLWRRDCVVILLCHYETPLRRRGNLMYSRTYEIAAQSEGAWGNEGTSI